MNEGPKARGEQPFKMMNKRSKAQRIWPPIRRLLVITLGLQQVLHTSLPYCEQSTVSLWALAARVDERAARDTCGQQTGGTSPPRTLEAGRRQLNTDEEAASPTASNEVLDPDSGRQRVNSLLIAEPVVEPSEARSWPRAKSARLPHNHRPASNEPRPTRPPTGQEPQLSQWAPMRQQAASKQSQSQTKQRRHLLARPHRDTRLVDGLQDLSAASGGLAPRAQAAPPTSRETQMLSQYLIQQLIASAGAGQPAMDATTSGAKLPSEPVNQSDSSMVSYSLLPAVSGQATPSLGEPNAAQLAQFGQPGSGQDQLLAALQYLGAQSASQQPAELAAPDANLVTMFESVFKNLLLQSGQQQQAAITSSTTSTTQAPAHQPADQANTTESAPAERLPIHFSASSIAPNPSQQHYLTPGMVAHQAHFMPPHQGTYSNDPFRPLSHKAKRIKSKKNRAPQFGMSPAASQPSVRVQKKPRQSAQKFYEHNSPSDLQPSATFHKLKHPWLYQDDEDEEEGETEINLRFFNNFSRMGPFSGIARTMGPASVFVSIAFLILSNISLAGTIIVHGISALLRTLTQNQSPFPNASASPSNNLSGPKSNSGRTARSIDLLDPKFIQQNTKCLMRDKAGSRRRKKRNAEADYDLVNLIESLATSWLKTLYSLLQIGNESTKSRIGLRLN